MHAYLTKFVVLTTEWLVTMVAWLYFGTTGYKDNQFPCCFLLFSSS